MFHSHIIISGRLSAGRLNGFSGDAQGDKESINPSHGLQPSERSFLNLVFFSELRRGCIGFPKRRNSVGAPRSSFLMRVRVKLERGRRFGAPSHHTQPPFGTFLNLMVFVPPGDLALRFSCK